MKRVLVMAATALLLSACATNSTHDGMVYRDGSWYAPADDGHGDYYTSSPRTYPYYGSAFDYPFDFGIGLLPYGGYCSVQYRWCSSYWPYYDPYWYQPWVAYQPSRHHRQHPDLADAGPQDDPLPLPRSSNGRARPQPDAWQERPVFTPRSGGGGGGRQRRGNNGNGGIGEGGNE